MRPRASAVLVATLLLGVALAGCADEEGPTPTGPGGSSASTSTTGEVAPPVVKPKSSSERWHFHDYWKGSPTIVLFDGIITLNATVFGPPGSVLSHVLALPPGVIVPAETGLIQVNASWDTPGGNVSVAYRPADSNDYALAGWLVPGDVLDIPTTESMCDVPHRQESFWRFNFTGHPTPDNPGIVPRDVHVTITATIGRPLFIDPPHTDWWAGGDVIPLVAGAAGELASVTTRTGNVTLPKDPLAQTTEGLATTTSAPARVPMDSGRIVPEGAKSVVVLLNWTSEVPGQKLTLRYKEGNFPSEGELPIVTDGEGSRLFAMEVRPPMTDTTYSNRTTWEFSVVPDMGGDEGAFRGTFSVVAWATRLAPDAAAALVTR